MPNMGRARTVSLAVLVGAVAIGATVWLSSGPGAHKTPSGSTASPGRSGATTAATPTSPTHPVAVAPTFALYYMWWDRQHWLARLGPDYPTTATRNPLPATLDSSGCGTVSNYPGNRLTDVSQDLKYDQSDPKTILHDVESAAASGLSGFAVNWIGTGQPSQSVNSSHYNQRLKYMFDAVHQVNANGIPFSLILNYQSSAKLLPVSQFSNDFHYFLTTYGHDPALNHTYSAKPEVIMAGTWKYTDQELEAISADARPDMYLIGDEKPASWDAARARSLDGTSYYWSSQDPTNNRSSFASLVQFAKRVRETPNPDGRAKTWLAPFTPGYNAMLLYGTPTCVARDDGQTMRALFQGNVASQPDGWTLISWNEISEGSYIVPLTRYGNRYLDILKALLHRTR